jgi:hypothetical protein
MTPARSPIPTLMRSPERASLDMLQASLTITHDALCAAHPQLASDDLDPPLTPVVRLLLVLVDLTHHAIDEYAALDDALPDIPDSDLPL